ncbi:MAG: M3 family oligoendopeptidase [Nitrospirae bacterium]|nr:M3 family oligoendopeptidase [Nitrospirota bacterium]
MEQIKWNLKQLFESDNDPRMELEKQRVEEKSYRFINRWKDRTDYLEDPVILKQALDEYESWERECGTDGDWGYYVWLRTQQDQNDPALKAASGQVDNFSRKIRNNIQFFTLRIAKIPVERQETFSSHSALREYRHFLSRIFAEAKYMLSEAEEKVLNMKSSTSYSNWVKLTSGFLAKEERSVLLEDGTKGLKNVSEMLSLLDNKNRKVRDSSAKALNAIFDKYAEVAEAELNSILENKQTDDELRGITRPDISRHIGDDIESDVVDSLIDTVSSRSSIAHRFYELKAGLMGLRKLKYHERNTEYGDIEQKYPYDESLMLVDKVFKRLDPEFSDILSTFIRNGHFDVYPGKGKGNGAFCTHHLISQPTYILLNHTDKLNDVLTLAHELGHGINNELVRKKQNALYFGTSTATAEVASTFMEDFVLQEILLNADDELKLAIMVKKINDDVSTIVRQAACYRFEQELHHDFREKGYLSKEEIGALFLKHMAAYMGPFVEQSAGSGNWWVYWSHIRYFFYVYSYASGLLISKALQHSVKENPLFIVKVKEFLSAGLSDSPRNIFLRLGIDITDPAFWHRGLDEVENLLNETIALARKLGKIS